jgi:hypothetical protein
MDGWVGCGCGWVLSGFLLVNTVKKYRSQTKKSLRDATVSRSPFNHPGAKITRRMGKK